MQFGRIVQALAVTMIVCLSAGSAHAISPVGVWIDHTGRGAVEITPCGSRLCGHIVWLKNSKHGGICRRQIIGNVRRIRRGLWDRGWIYDPERNSRYSVELKPIGKNKLRVMGYLGSKFFSETMIWRRADGSLERCDGVRSATGKPATQTTAQPSAKSSAQPPAKPSVVPPRPKLAKRTGTKRPDAKPAASGEVAAHTPRTAATSTQQRAAIEPKPSTATSGTSTAKKEQATRQANSAAKRPRRRPGQSRRGRSRTCKLDLPYVNVRLTFDCKLKNFN